MKKYFLSICVLGTYASFATVHTVSNNPANVAQFNSIQAAIDAAAAGDTVLVHGSPNAYAAFTIDNKKIAIIGPGYAPDKSLSLSASVPGFTITGANASGSEIQGMLVSSFVTINANKPDNIIFRRNYFNGFFDLSINQSAATYSGYLFESNYFLQCRIVGQAAATYENFIFRNNVFFESVNWDYSLRDLFNCANVLFDHNLFLAGTSARGIFFNCRFMLLTNNIFVRRNAATGLSFSSFSNNLTFNATESTPWTLNSNTNGGGNVANQNPQMVDQAAVDAGTANPLHNYSIVAGPAKGSGTGGRDMGLRYDNAGPLNWANGRNSRLPRIFSMTLNSIDVQAGGNLNIQIQGRRSN